MGDKRGGKRAKKLPGVKSSNGRAETAKTQAQERKNAMTILQAKTKLATELEKLKKTEAVIDIQKIIADVNGKNAENVLNADDIMFSDMDSITTLLRHVSIAQNAEDNNAQNQTSQKDNSTENDILLTDHEVMAFACALAKTPKNVDEDDESPAEQRYLLDIQIKLCLKVINRLNDGGKKYPTGKMSKLILNTVDIVQNLVGSLVAVRRYLAMVPLKSEFTQEKDIPLTEKLYYAGNYMEHDYHVKVLEKHQHYKFEFPEEDVLLSHYASRTRQIIKRPCLMIQWAIDSEPHLKVQFSVRQKLQKKIQKGRDAYDRLNSLSQVIAFLKPSFDKKRNEKYNEMSMMLHVIRDQFTRELKPTDSQLAQIAKMKDVEMKRRVAEKQCDLDAMIKNFEYIDIQLSKTRSKNRTARFYFYLVGYIEAQCNIITDAYWHTQETMSQQLGNIYNSHALRCGKEPLTIETALISELNLHI